MNYIKTKLNIIEPEFHYKKFIKTLKRKKKGLMSKRQYMRIADELNEISPCDLLVFGLGEDSYLWNSINENGITVFLEDSKEWIDEINNGSLNVHQVVYTTSVKDFEKIGFDEKKMVLELPEEVECKQWDFIIVDAPLGHQPPRPFKGPGRMSSIYSAYRLLKPGGIVVVDDMGRAVEKKYAYHYFGKDNLKVLIENKLGIFQNKHDKALK